MVPTEYPSSEPIECGSQQIHVMRGSVLAGDGLFVLVCGSGESELNIYRLMAKRSSTVWGERVHRFYQVTGVIVMVVGILARLDIFERSR